MSVFSKFRQTLDKTRRALSERVTSLLGQASVDEATLEELEEALLSADVGPTTSMRLIEQVRTARDQGETPAEALERSVRDILIDGAGMLVKPAHRPHCIMVVGVNGVGKTTTIAKLANYFCVQDKKVLLAAADTFRAAAIEQLEIWAGRVGCDIVRHREGSDPAAVVYDALSAAKAREVDVLIVDTAGRLHTKVNLMNELKKIHKVMAREVEGAPHETLLVLDANTGQNALQQARVFKDATEVSGIVITKLDGTAKGGVVISIAAELEIPLKFITTGEKVQDIEVFDPHEFARALFS